MRNLLATQSPHIRLEGMIPNSTVVPIEIIKDWVILRIRTRDPPPPGWFSAKVVNKVGLAVRARATRRKRNRQIRWDALFRVMGMNENFARVARIMMRSRSRHINRVIALITNEATKWLGNRAEVESFGTGLMLFWQSGGR